MNPLVAAGAKVARAGEHVSALIKAGEGFFESNRADLFETVGEANPQRTKYVFRAKDVKPLPVPEWGVIVGDIVHCLRSALDQLVWALAPQHSAATRFPIMVTERDWVTRAPSMIWSVPPKYVALIHSVQPYLRGDAAHAHPLAILNALWNLDKHKVIPTTALVPNRMEWIVRATEGVEDHGPLKLKIGTPLKEDAVLAECSIVSDGSGVEPKLYVETNTTFDIGFGKTPGKTAVPSAIWGKSVIEAFNTIFGPYIVDEVFMKFGELLDAQASSGMNH